MNQCLSAFSIWLIASYLIASPSILKTPQPIRIDGVLDEPIWKQTAVYSLAWISGGKDHGKVIPKEKGRVRYCWDESYFYLAYEIYDSNIINGEPSGEKGPPHNRRAKLVKVQGELPIDFVSILISCGEREYFWQIDHNASNHFREVFYLCPSKDSQLSKSSLANQDGMVIFEELFLPDHRGVLWDTGESFLLPLKAATQLISPSTIATSLQQAQAQDEDKGYTAEIQIPWIGLGVPRHLQQGKHFQLAREKIRILTMYRDGTYPDCYFTPILLDKDIPILNQVDKWPVFQLVP